jgi:ribonuclease PH
MPEAVEHDYYNNMMMCTFFQVLAAVYGPRVTDIRSQALHDKAVVKCEYSEAAFSTGAQRQWVLHVSKARLLGRILLFPIC